ncbi:MAG: hypothetical protein PVF85_00105 [Anaerolineales bacterium]|jgi:hypothetical protein
MTEALKHVRIHIRGRIDEQWTHWFEGLRVEQREDDTTMLIGELADQSALYGLLAKLRDLGLELISIESS